MAKRKGFAVLGDLPALLLAAGVAALLLCVPLAALADNVLLGRVTPFETEAKAQVKAQARALGEKDPGTHAPPERGLAWGKKVAGAHAPPAHDRAGGHKGPGTHTAPAQGHAQGSKVPGTRAPPAPVAAGTKPLGAAAGVRGARSSAGSQGSALTPEAVLAISLAMRATPGEAGWSTGVATGAVEGGALGSAGSGAAGAEGHAAKALKGAAAGVSVGPTELGAAGDAWAGRGVPGGQRAATFPGKAEDGKGGKTPWTKAGTGKVWSGNLWMPEEAWRKGPAQQLPSGAQSLRTASQGQVNAGPCEVNSSCTLLQAIDFIGGRNRSIIVVTVAHNFLHFLENWVGFVAKLGLTDRVLFIAEGERSFKYLSAKWPSQVVRAADMAPVQELPSLGRVDAYGSAFYREVVSRRPRYFLALLSLNVSFLYSDLDIVLLRNPFPFFTGDFDLWMQEDVQTTLQENRGRFKASRPEAALKRPLHHLCTGLMMVRATPGSALLISRWASKLEKRARTAKRKGVNQQVFNEVRFRATESEVRVAALPVGLFPSGCIWFPSPLFPHCKAARDSFRRQFPHWRDWVVAIHNNFIIGNEVKIQRFKNESLWLL